MSASSRDEVDLLIDTEASNVIPLRPEFPAPKGKRMQNYRLSSSAYTGRAPRSLNAAFGCHPNDPVHPMPDGRVAMGEALARAAKALGRFIARVFGR